MSHKKFITAIAPPALDLRQRHFETTANGMHVIGTWYRHDRRKFEPCLVLLHASRPIKAGRTVPIVILLSDAWRWAFHGNVGDPAHCVGQIIKWLHAELLPGNPANKPDHLKVMEAINSRLTDLIAMPPRPKGEAVVIADAIITDQNSGKTIEQEVITDV